MKLSILMLSLMAMSPLPAFGYGGTAHMDDRPMKFSSPAQSQNGEDCEKKGAQSPTEQGEAASTENTSSNKYDGITRNPRL